jgi:3D (Asp-Asp-Asp) domain-containing protein
VPSELEQEARSLLKFNAVAQGRGNEFDSCNGVTATGLKQKKTVGKRCY